MNAGCDKLNTTKFKRVGILSFCEWRPRPKLVLTEKEIENLTKSMDSFKTEFMEEDRIKEQLESQEESSKIHSMLANYLQWMGKLNLKPRWRAVE